MMSLNSVASGNGYHKTPQIQTFSRDNDGLQSYVPTLRPTPNSNSLSLKEELAKQMKSFPSQKIIVPLGKDRHELMESSFGPTGGAHGSDNSSNPRESSNRKNNNLPYSVSLLSVSQSQKQFLGMDPIIPN